MSPEPSGLLTTDCRFQVQSIEFTQIEMKVMEGLQVGNECLNKMHQVGPVGLGRQVQLQATQGRGGGASSGPESSWTGVCQCLTGTSGTRGRGGTAQPLSCVPWCCVVGKAGNGDLSAQEAAWVW